MDICLSVITFLYKTNGLQIFAVECGLGVAIIVEIDSAFLGNCFIVFDILLSRL